MLRDTLTQTAAHPCQSVDIMWNGSWETLDADNTSVCSFIALANVRHHRPTMQRLTAASGLIHIHSQIKSAPYRCFQLLALCSLSASADFQALSFLNIPACWNQTALEHAALGSLSGLLSGNVHFEWHFEMLSWLRNGWKVLGFF